MDRGLAKPIINNGVFNCLNEIRADLSKNKLQETKERDKNMPFAWKRT